MAAFHLYRFVRYTALNPMASGFQSLLHATKSAELLHATASRGVGSGSRLT